MFFEMSFVFLVHFAKPWSHFGSQKDAKWHHFAWFLDAFWLSKGHKLVLKWCQNGTEMHAKWCQKGDILRGFSHGFWGSWQWKWLKSVTQVVEIEGPGFVNEFGLHLFRISCRVFVFFSCFFSFFMQNLEENYMILGTKNMLSGTIEKKNLQNLFDLSRKMKFWCVCSGAK